MNLSITSEFLQNSSTFVKKMADMFPLKRFTTPEIDTVCLCIVILSNAIVTTGLSLVTGSGLLKIFVRFFALFRQTNGHFYGNGRPMFSDSRAHAKKTQDALIPRISLLTAHRWTTLFLSSRLFIILCLVYLAFYLELLFRDSALNTWYSQDAIYKQRLAQRMISTTKFTGILLGEQESVRW